MAGRKGMQTTITRKGQVTIPAEIRRELDLKEGERISVERHGDAVVLRRARSVTEQTAGVLASYRRTPPLTAEEERAAFEEAVAAEVAADEGP